ncbi:hypothetical protein [Jannaschia rubra]|uniref:hypothetical protein n=1 Tax=Jannaschia rubra TaxID=282197 RepID=UPI0024930145|nr:hypothetical protein [Jannaschia rubra]
MENYLQTDFIGVETGAITVNWVVMTAAVVGLGLAVTAVVAGGVGSSSGDIAAVLSGNDIAFRAAHFHRTPVEVARAADLTHYNAR